MFYVSKVSPFFFVVAYVNLFVSLFFKANNDILYLGLVLVYGFIFNVVLGGLYQIVPNSQSRKLNVSQVSFFVLFISFCADLSLFLIKNFEIFAVLKFFTVLVFLIHILSVVKIVKPLTIRFIVTGLFYLFLSVLSLVSFEVFGKGSYQLSIHLFTIGVMSNLIIGVLFTWIPMLTMQVINLKLADRFYYIYQFTSGLFLLSFLMGNHTFITVSGIVLFLTVLFYLYIIYDSVFKGKKVIVLPVVVKYFLAGWFLFLIGVLTVLFILIFGRFDLLILHIDFMVYGFGFTILSGAIIHLLPRIVWNWFSQQIKKSDFPNINSLVNEKLVMRLLYFYIPFLFVNISLDYLNFLKLSVFFMFVFYVVFIALSFYRVMRYLKS